MDALEIRLPIAILGSLGLIVAYLAIVAVLFRRSRKRPKPPPDNASDVQHGK